MKRRGLVLLMVMLMLSGCASASRPRPQASKPSQTNESEEKDNKKEKKSKEESNTTVKDNRKKDKEDSEKKEKKESKSDENISVSDKDFETTGYLYENMIGDSLYFYIVKNNSKATVGVDGNATAYDADGNVIGASQRDIDVLGAGETSLMAFYFDSVTGIDKVDCSLTYDTNTYYMPVIGNIHMDQTINDQNMTIVATNEGSYNAQFVEAYALFFDANNNVVSYASNYVVDGDSEIKPGASISVQLDTYKGFDHVECFLTGRSDGSASSASSASSGVSDSDFSIKEYSYENLIGDSKYFLAITNNSNKAVGINVNMTAYDAVGNVIGADSGSIDIIGPGEQSIADFYFDSVTGIDHVEYTMSYDMDSYYKPVLSDLDIVQSINDKNVVVTVTNNGSEPAQFVEAYALFLDSSGKVIYADSTYVVDEDSEIKPGATISKQLDVYDAFDTVDVYFTGRR